MRVVLELTRRETCEIVTNWVLQNLAQYGVNNAVKFQNYETLEDGSITLNFAQPMED